MSPDPLHKYRSVGYIREPVVFHYQRRKLRLSDIRQYRRRGRQIIQDLPDIANNRITSLRRQNRRFERTEQRKRMIDQLLRSMERVLQRKVSTVECCEIRLS